MLSPASAPMTHAAILFAHGARDSAWSRPFEAVSLLGPIAEAQGVMQALAREAAGLEHTP
jgi:hypothetical protein